MILTRQKRQNRKQGNKGTAKSANASQIIVQTLRDLPRLTLTGQKMQTKQHKTGEQRSCKTSKRPKTSIKILKTHV